MNASIKCLTVLGIWRSMETTAQDFYLLFCDHKIKKVSDVIQDGFSGMYLVLRFLGEEKKEYSAGDLSQMLGLTTARTAVILLTLKKKGYIVRSKSQEDARKTIVKITPKGAAALEERKAKIFDKIDSFLKKLDEHEIGQLFHILEKLLTK